MLHEADLSRASPELTPYEKIPSFDLGEDSPAPQRSAARRVCIALMKSRPWLRRLSLAVVLIPAAHAGWFAQWQCTAHYRSLETNGNISSGEGFTAKHKGERGWIARQEKAHLVSRFGSVRPMEISPNTGSRLMGPNKRTAKSRVYASKGVGFSAQRSEICRIDGILAVYLSPSAPVRVRSREGARRFIDGILMERCPFLRVP